MLADRARTFRRLSRNAQLYLIANAIQAVSAGALAVIYTLYLAALGYGTGFIGLLVVVGSIGGALGILPASAVVRRWGWRTTLIWSDLIGGVALLLQLVYPLRWVLLVTSLGVGASVALLLVVNSPFLAANSGAEDRTAVFAINNALAFLAAVVGAFLGGALPAWFAAPAVRDSGVLRVLAPLLLPGGHARTYQLALLATGALALPSILPVLWLRDEGPAQNSHRGHGGNGGPHREDITPSPAASVPPHPSPTPAAFPPPSPAAVGEGPGVRASLARWRQVRAVAQGPVGRFALTQAMVGFGAGLFGPYVNLYFVNVLGASTVLYGSLAATLTILQALGSLLIVPLAARLGNIRAAVAAELVSLPFLVALGSVPPLAIAAVVFLIRGPLMNAGGPALQSFLMGAVPEDERVVASGVYNVSWQLAGAVGAGAGGWLIARAGYPPAFYAAAGFYAVSIALVGLWFGRTAARVHDPK